jgi:two-component system phosphate regulon response regulator PhoB
MLVDDDPSVADMYRLGLETGGFDVKVFHNPEAFYQALEEEVPDVCVLDWELGMITGADVLDRIRTDPRTTDLPVFMISNHPEESADGRAARAGALAWLVKTRTTPIELSERLSQATRKDGERP